MLAVLVVPVVLAVPLAVLLVPVALVVPLALAVPVPVVPWGPQRLVRVEDERPQTLVEHPLLPLHLLPVQGSARSSPLSCAQELQSPTAVLQPPSPPP